MVLFQRASVRYGKGFAGLCKVLNLNAQDFSARCEFEAWVLHRSEGRCKTGAPMDHINIRILPNSISGIPLILGFGTRM